MKLLIKTLVVIISIAFLNNCNTTEPPPPPPDELKPELELKLDDTSCTEAWLQLTTKDLQLPAELILKQYNPTGDSVAQIFSLSTKDSLLYIDSLLPNQNYSFQVSSILHQVSSIKLQVTTMDTTSHNFTFESWTFGTVGSSTLYDVAIIDENNIWAVGEIMIADTSQNGYTTYNAVHWDGRSWEVKRIMFYTICGQQSRSSYPAKAVFAFNENEIWIAMDGDQIVKLENGVQVKTICLPWSFSINKIWGSSSNDLYIVGNSGNIAHYGGPAVGWKKIESNTNKMLSDIYGYNKNVWISGYDLTGSIILKVQDQKVDMRYESNLHFTVPGGISGLVEGIWTPNEFSFYAVSSSGLYRGDRNLTGNFQSIYKNYDNFEGGYLSLRGTNHNNIFTGGYNGSIHHFNGSSWFTFQETIDYNQIIYNLDVKENIVVGVGETFINTFEYKGIILIGRKNSY